MAIKKRPVSPRQKMINLMYVVLMAMLALNVSTEVLDGFTLVEDGLKRSTHSIAQENNAIYGNFKAQMEANPTKVKLWYAKAMLVRTMSDSLYNLADSLKLAIVQEADGSNGDVNNIRNKEDLEAANQVMIAPGKQKGKELRDAIVRYRTKMLSMISDKKQKAIIAENLSTDVPEKVVKTGKNWQEYMFESMPTAAAVTLLSKLQNDIRYTEGEVLHTLAKNIDQKDLRVNELSAFVIPESETVVKGNPFRARIVMAAVDSTKKPSIFLESLRETTKIKNGVYETICNSVGTFQLKGFLTATDNNGNSIQCNFDQPYTVVEPSATVSADMMRMLYAGYNNPISVSVPGVPLSSITLSMTNGTLTRTGEGRYIARPSTVGKDAVITVFANHQGRQQQMAQHSFRVRKLPEPNPYISIKDENGVASRYKGGAIARTSLASVDGISAAIDDGLLDVPFKVLSFETVFFDGMGNAVPMASNGAAFSDRQIESFRKMKRNRRFYISHIKAVGPDGIERKLNSSIEVIVR